MHRIALLVVFAILAGCTQPAHPGPAAASPAPFMLPVDLQGHSATSPSCPLGCTPFPTVLVQLAANETLAGFTLEFTAVPRHAADPPPVTRWSVVCLGGARPCGDGPLAAGQGTALHLERHGLATPQGASIQVRAETDAAQTDSVSNFQPGFTVRGTVQVRQSAGVAVQTPVSFDGIAGICGMGIEPTCNSVPLGTLEGVAVSGTPRQIHLAATWTATTPLAQAMSLQVNCQAPGCPDNGFFVKTGPSPLVLDVDAWTYPTNATFLVHLDFTNAATAAGIRQAYHVEGAFVSAA